MVAPEPLYASARGLYNFQADGVARSYLRMEDGGGVLCTWETGLGKSHLAMALAAMFIEDGLIDLVVLVAERGKITNDEWPKDLGKFTRLSWARHHGTGRMDRLAKKGLPQVLVTTYETGKGDLAKFTKGKRGTVLLSDGPLMEMILGKRVLFIFDESGKLKNRSTHTYKAWNRTLEHMRRKAPQRVLAMSATPIEKDYEDAYNQLRIVDPRKVPLVKDFEADYIASRDPYDRPRYHRDKMPEFAALVRPMILHKRKTDPDVMEEFPKQVEESHWVEMAPDQRSLYEMVCDLQDPGDEEPMPGLYTIKRMVCAYPEAIVHSAKNGSSALAKLLVDELGENYFRSVSSAKATELINYLEPLVKGQGAKVVVFSFFGPSVLPLLERDLRAKGFRVYLTYGGMTMAEIATQRQAFKDDPLPAVLLSSDAGARGVNLPEATYVVEYESALTFANRTQRLNRIHRIDSTAPSVTCMTFFMKESVEETIAKNMIDRNEQHDVLLADDDAGDDFISAAERRQALQIARTPKNRKSD